MKDRRQRRFRVRGILAENSDVVALLARARRDRRREGGGLAARRDRGARGRGGRVRVRQRIGPVQHHHSDLHMRKIGDEIGLAVGLCEKSCAIDQPFSPADGVDHRVLMIGGGNEDLG